jgi:hypothetical protein
MDVLNVELQESVTNNYSIEFGNNGGRQKIVATNVNDFVCTNTASWISFSHNGNEMDIIVLPNTDDVERTTELYLKSKFYYDSYAIIEITQKETTYSVETVSSIEGIKVYNDNISETKEETIKVDGATKRCILKGIKQYLEEESSDGTTSYYLTTFDNGINVKLIQTEEDGVYTLRLTNYGKVTKGDTYYIITLCHRDNIDTECEIKVTYENESSLTTLLDANGKQTKSVSLEFDYCGYCSDNIIKLFTTEDTVDFTTEENWLYCRLGYDCIKIFADYNDGTSDRSGTITIGDNTVNVSQSGKIATDSLDLENSLSVASLMDEEVEYIEDTTPAIELIAIKDNTVECKTYIYNSKTDVYDNDSQVAVFIYSKWLSYETSYNTETNTHLIKLIPKENKWQLDRKCIIRIANAEDTYEPIVLEAKQSYQEEIVSIEQLTIN